LSWYAFVTAYARDHWVGRAGTTRNSTREAVLHRALRSWAFVVPGPEAREIPAQDRLVLAWVAKASRPLVDLYDPAVARDVLEALRLNSTDVRSAWPNCRA
jgi:hypothetical protein